MTNLTKIDVYEVVKKLTGLITPVGSTDIDAERLQNLEQLTTLVDKLLSDIDAVAAREGDARHSVNIAGQQASKFFNKLGISDE